jgi:hypothetical protein
MAKWRSKMKYRMAFELIAARYGYPELAALWEGLGARPRGFRRRLSSSASCI